MIHNKVKIPYENAHDIMVQLGALDNCIEFVDLNKNIIETKKTFNKLIIRCDEIEKIFLDLSQKFEKLIKIMNYLIDLIYIKIMNYLIDI